MDAQRTRTLLVYCVIVTTIYYPRCIKSHTHLYPRVDVAFPPNWSRALVFWRHRCRTRALRKPVPDVLNGDRRETERERSRELEREPCLDRPYPRRAPRYRYRTAGATRKPDRLSYAVRNKLSRNGRRVPTSGRKNKRRLVPPV